MFTSADDQQKAVNRIVNAMLGAIPDLQRKDLAAVEWSVNEITDNVLNHSQSGIGGLVQVSTFQKARKRVEYIVADAGVGIPKTLRGTHTDLTSDAEALDRAIAKASPETEQSVKGTAYSAATRFVVTATAFFRLSLGTGSWSSPNGMACGSVRRKCHSMELWSFSN
jgi:hypothetical protein